MKKEKSSNFLTGYKLLFPLCLRVFIDIWNFWDHFAILTDSNKMHVWSTIFEKVIAPFESIRKRFKDEWNLLKDKSYHHSSWNLILSSWRSDFEKIQKSVILKILKILTNLTEFNVQNYKIQSFFHGDFKFSTFNPK